MARYIDADALVEMLNNKAKTDFEMGLYNHGALTQSFIKFVERQPTSDVVPKSEVLKLIEDIASCCTGEDTEDMDFAIGYYTAMNKVLLRLAVLKEKYAEE